MRKRVIFFVLLLSLLTVTAPMVGAQDDRLQVVGSHSILSDVIMNVAGDVADVASVMPRGADPHSFQPTPSDLTTLADADVVFINGMLFEEGLLEAIENAGDDMNIIIASSCVEIIAFGGHSDEHDHESGDDHEDGDNHEDGNDMGDMSAIATLCEQHNAEMEALHADSHEGDESHEHGDDEASDEHAHEEDEDHDHSDVETLGALYTADCGEGHSHGGEEHEGEEEAHDESGEHKHDHGACDPHVWMEPHNVMYWTMLIRDTLVELDPANAETYTANASAYLEAVDELAHDFVMRMIETVPEENRILITNHDAFGYFATRYDFEIAESIIPSFSTLAEPSAGDIAEIIDLINEQDIPAIFAETTVSDQLVQQVAEETGVPVAILYTGSLSDEDGPASTYLDYIRYNVTTIVDALGGGMASFDTGLMTIDCTRTDADGNETGDVCLLEPDGTVTNLTNVPIGTYAYRGYFDNSCSRIVFYSNFEGTEDIYTMAIDGSDLQRVTNDDARDYNASYSPGGNQITWVSHLEDSENGDIWVIDADGSNRQNLTPDEFRDRTPFFSPDGSVIGFHSYRGDEGYGNIYLISADGNELEQLTSGEHRFFAYNVEWSPNGNQILFLTERDGAVDVYTMTADGSDEQLILSDVGHTVANWSPDGTQIIFNSERPEVGNFRQMFIGHVDGTGVQPLEPLSIDEGNYFGVRDWCSPSN